MTTSSCVSFWMTKVTFYVLTYGFPFINEFQVQSESLLYVLDHDIFRLRIKRSYQDEPSALVFTYCMHMLYYVHDNLYVIMSVLFPISKMKLKSCGVNRIKKNQYILMSLLKRPCYTKIQYNIMLQMRMLMDRKVSVLYCIIRKILMLKEYYV